MKLRSSTKILIGFLAFLAMWFGGRWMYGEWRLRGVSFPPLAPKTVNLIGVDTLKGRYRIVVANRMAQLILSPPGEFEAPDDRTRESDSGEKRRIPIREMLEAHQGNQKALDRFIMVLNERKEEDIPPYPIVWTAEDIRKALEGDPELRVRLEEDLNVRLDGTPLEAANPRALADGIVIDLPVPVRIRRTSITGEEDTLELVGRLQEPFKPNFAVDVYARYREKDATPAMIAGYYREEARKIASGQRAKQDIEAYLRDLISSRRCAEYAEVPERLLNSIRVILTDDHIESASTRAYRSPEGREMFELKIKLTPEGRERLWQYSRGRVGSQLLLVSRGIAVAAPTIKNELAESEVTITQLTEEQLVRSTLEALKGRGKGGP